MRKQHGPLSARSARNLVCGDEGAVTMMFAICASMMIGSMCMAIDSIHYEMTQARMQMALDVATLSAGADLAHYDTTKPADLANWKTDARAFYDVNMPSGYLALNMPNANFSASVTGAPATGQTIKLSASGSMPLLAPVFFGKAKTDTGSDSGNNQTNPDTATVSASNAALRLPKSTLELVMVLDNTGSMSDYANTKDYTAGTKITGLRAAAQNLVTSIFQSSTTDSYVGLVPFTTMVNVKNALQPTGKWITPLFDNYNAQHMSMTASKNWKGSGWGGCAVEPRDAGGNLRAEAYEPASSPNFRPFFWNVPKNSFSVYTYTKSTKNKITTCTINSNPTVTVGAPLTYLTSGSVTTSCGTTYSGATPPAIYDQWYVNSSSNSTSTTTYDQNGNTNYGTNGPCNIAPALFLTKSQSDLTTAITNMKAAGSTLIPTGLLWGWRMLKSSWSDNVAGAGNGFISTDTSLPRPETTQGLQRVVIVLTDGENDPGGSTGFMPPQAFNGLSGVGRADLTSSTVFPKGPGSMGSVDDINTYQLAVCSAMKQDGIIIYSITFGTYGTDTASVSAQTTMQNCASPGNYYHAPSNTTLNQIFQQIAGNLGVLRLTQ
ncbi:MULTISPECIES: Flp pilus assembly protein TadG [Caballeronia]|uniref:Pilus assembly protein TadG n=1 Tax=Caballeronia zhejiangensis TaxID=871203 RepID=A0A656QEJ6_9BURK|nr:MULTISPECIES: Flp pilus assembly protein TadG [Caballeronia]EKS66334.1 Flp pilus assembly protein TadG [Burkholderia sp. SJ98]KDR28018.1 pilus assembly protein TadG [Caballeronia zhejiangensis]MDR5789102.1 VWA domain-containing protein [Caballeronia sp. LP003]